MHPWQLLCEKNWKFVCAWITRKLNSITVRDTFPLPRIDEALQAVHSSNWFSSFDLAEGYLQLGMEESDIKKTTFRPSPMGLYEFIHMPFGLLDVGSSFCHLMEQCLGDQQFVTYCCTLMTSAFLSLQ